MTSFKSGVGIEPPTNLTKKTLRGQNIDYHKLDDQHKSLVDKSRAEESNKWMDFGAAVPLQTKVIDELLRRGHGLMPTQWIDVDTDPHLQRPGKAHQPRYKSRLVACGQFENCPEVRTDSPTCDVEGLNLICSFAA